MSTAFPMSAPIAILSALPEEGTELASLMSEVHEHPWVGGPLREGRIGQRRVVYAISGVGKTLSAMLTQHVIDRFSPSAVLFIGLAGALSLQYERGDVVLGETLVQHDMDARAMGFARGEIPYTGMRELTGAPELLKVAERVSIPGLRVRRGRILTGDQFVSRAEQDNPATSYLIQELQGDAVEMEGASVALVCARHEVPCLVIRTISDAADGGAATDFLSFLNEASRRSALLVREILSTL